MIGDAFRDERTESRGIRVAGVDWDSLLEASVWLTLEALGVDAWARPDGVMLRDGTRWEPDMVQRGTGGESDVYLEVKGDHDNRLWKAHEAAGMGHRIVIIRPGVVSTDAESVRAGLEWEDAGDGRDWVLVVNGPRARFADWNELSVEERRGDVRWAARLVESNEKLVGVEMKHWSEANRERD